jgi:hypothetical protein
MEFGILFQSAQGGVVLVEGGEGPVEVDGLMAGMQNQQGVEMLLADVVIAFRSAGSGVDIAGVGDDQPQVVLIWFGAGLISDPALDLADIWSPNRG